MPYSDRVELGVTGEVGEGLDVVSPSCEYCDAFDRVAARTESFVCIR